MRNYESNLIQDIKVTEEFLGLGQEITRCQTKEFRPDCISRRYQEQVLLSLCISLHHTSLSTGGFIGKKMQEIFSYIARLRSAPANSWTV